MKKLQFIFAAAALLVLSLGMTGCDPNNPNNPNMPAIVSTSETNNAYGIVVEVIYKNNTHLYFQLTSPTECALTSYQDYYGWYNEEGFEQYAYSGDLVIPESITHKGVTYTVSGIYSFGEATSILIPKTVKTMRVSGTELLKAFNVATDNPYYTSVDGVLFTKDKTQLIKYPSGKVGKSYTIPEGTTAIGYTDNVEESSSRSFYNVQLTSIIIPNSMTEISDYAFRDCFNLTSITIPNSVTIIGIEAFSSCSSLNSVNIPESVTQIGIYAFEYCHSLKSITIPNGVTRIAGGIFSGCDSLTSITIPSSVTEFGGRVFAGCKGLASITCLALVPPVTATENFNYTFYESSILTVKVPAGSVEAYRVADVWKHLTIVAL